MNKAMLLGVTVLAVGVLFFASYLGALLGGDGQTTALIDTSADDFRIIFNDSNGTTRVVMLVSPG